MVTVTVEQFVNDFSNELAERNAAIFAGAGLSVSAGFVDWKSLVKPLADALKLDVEKEQHDLVKLAQYHVNHYRNRNDVSNAILNGFSRQNAKVTDSHRILVRLPISTWWTTNYDTLIETALKEGGKVPDVKFEPEHLMLTKSGRDAIVYKMHGDVSNPTTAVLCKEDYETYHLNRGDFLTALAGDLMSKMFLFIGFSFADPNLDYVLGRLHTRHGKNMRTHYCFVKTESEQKGDQPGDLAYRRAKQEFFIDDLQRHNIRTVMVKEYGDITDILRRVERKFKSRSVFVSGAAHEYEPWKQEPALDFVRKLGMALVERKFRIVTGLGLGIGNTVVDGALYQVYKKEKRNLGDDLVMRPFPQSKEAKEMWKQYRGEMLDFAGIALFMFGNKLAEGGTPMDSPGVMEEFEIAHSKGIKVLPLGFTGYASRILWERVKADFASYYPDADEKFKNLFGLLGDGSRSLDDQLLTVLDALDELKGK